MAVLNKHTHTQSHSAFCHQWAAKQSSD